MSHLSYRDGSAIELAVDYAVVGSGAGGAAAAATLARAGYSVGLIEAGPWRDPTDYPESAYGAMRDLWADWGSLFARGDSMIPILQASVVGGGTVINSAILVRTPGDVLAEWARLGLGDVFTEQAGGGRRPRRCCTTSTRRPRMALRAVPTPSGCSGLSGRAAPTGPRRSELRPIVAAPGSASRAAGAAPSARPTSRSCPR